MFKHNSFIHFVVGLISLMLLFGGCEKQAETPPKPKVITKKIIASKGVSLPPKPKTTKTKQPVVKQLMPKPEVQTVSTPAPEPKVATTAQTATQPKAKAVTQQMPKPQAKIIAKQKQTPETVPASKPVSESKDLGASISDQKVAADKKLIAALSPTAEKMLQQRGEAIYSSEGKLDPFAPLFEEKRVEPAAIRPHKKTVKRIPLTPLEKVDLSQLKLVAIIRATSGDKALVTEASGKGYVVKKGTPIGNRFGKIVDILADRIVVEEEVEDIYGKVSVQKRSLQIQKPLGE